MPERHPRRIVVGYDGQEHALDVARAALDMHHRFGAGVEFVHALDLPRIEDVAGRPDLVVGAEAGIESKAYETIALQLEGVAGEMEGTSYPVRDYLRVDRSGPAAAIVSRATEVQADLIMIGPHTKSGVFDFGSTARAVLGKAPCDVWVQPCPRGSIRRILVPTDLSQESLRSLESARDLAQGYGATVTPLHCFVQPQFGFGAEYPVAGPTYVVEELRKAAEQNFVQAVEAVDWKGVEHERRFVQGHPSEVILELQEYFDLIAMGSHGRTGLAAAVLGNVAYTVLKSARVPVLAFRHLGRDWLLG